jgi:hypothetical protein
MIDVEKALLDPAAIFRHPQQVIDTNDLSRDQKIEVLRRWEYDVREIQVLDHYCPVNFGIKTVGYQN